MAKDFRSERLRTRAIIGTGSVVAGKPNLNLMFYSGSKATNFQGGSNVDVSQVGHDVWLYIDGAASTGIDPSSKAAGSTVLFGGDVVVSGTLWSERSVVEVDDSVPGDFKAFNKVIGGMPSGYPENYNTGFARILVDPTTPNPSANRDGTVSFNMVQGVAGVWSYVNQFPASGAGAKHTDVFFHVSGSRGVKGTNDRGLALFDGDVMISGNLDLSVDSTLTIPGDLTVGNRLRVNGDQISGSDGGVLRFWNAHPSDGSIGNRSLAIEGDLRVGARFGTVSYIYNNYTGPGDAGAYQAPAGGDSFNLALSGNNDVAVGRELQFSGVGDSSDYSGGIKNKKGQRIVRFSSTEPGLVRDNAENGYDLRLMGDPVAANRAPVLVLDQPTTVNPAAKYEGAINIGTTNSSRGIQINVHQGNVDDTVDFFRVLKGTDRQSRGTDVGGFDDNTDTLMVLTSSTKQAQFRGPAQFDDDIKNAEGVVVIQPSDADNKLRFPAGMVVYGDSDLTGDVTITGDFTVKGNTKVTKIEHSQVTIEDKMILLASGTLTSNTISGIAFASGSSVTDQAMIFGPSGEYFGRTDCFKFGRGDVEDGALGPATVLQGSEPVGIEAAQFIIPNPARSPSTDLTQDFFITSSIDGAGLRNHVTMSCTDGAVKIGGTGDNWLRVGMSPIGDSVVHSTYPFSIGVPKSAAAPPIRGSGGFEFTLGTLDRGRILSPQGFMLWGAGNTGWNDTFIALNPNHDAVDLYATRNSIWARAKPGSGNIFDNGLAISGSGRITLNAEMNHGNPQMATLLELSASSDCPDGGPVIILSASAQYGGDKTLKSGFISLGARTTEVDNLFSISSYRDVRTLLSGAVGTAGSNTRGVSLVSGDLVVSGNTDIKGVTKIGTLDVSNLTLSSTTSDEPYLRFRDSSVQIRRNALNHLEFADAQAPSSPYTLTQLAALSVTDNTDVYAVTHQDGTAPYLSYVASTGSFSFDHSPTTDGYAARRTNQIGDDVYFFVSGAVGSRATSTRGSAVFGGDLVVSGAMRIQTPGTGIVVPMQIGSAASTGDIALAVTGSIDLIDPGSTSVNITSKAGGLNLATSTGTAIGIDYSNQITANGNLKMSNNNAIYLKSSTRYINGLIDGGVEKLKIKNSEANGVIILEPGSGTGHLAVSGSMLPGSDSTYNLGSPDARWANVYTGDLHLRNERGNWTIYEEPDMLVVVNNLTGKKYKMGLTPLEDEE